MPAAGVGRSTDMCTAEVGCGTHPSTTDVRCTAEMRSAAATEMGAATTANGVRRSASAASSWSRIRGACYCGGQDNSGIEVYSCPG